MAKKKTATTQQASSTTASKKAPGKTAAKKATAGKTTSKEVAKKSAVQKTAAKKAVVKKAAAKKAVTKKVAAKKAVTKKTTAKKAVTKKAVTKKAAAKKVTTTKVAAKKAAAKKVAAKSSAAAAAKPAAKVVKKAPAKQPLAKKVAKKVAKQVVAKQAPTKTAPAKASTKAPAKPASKPVEPQAVTKKSAQRVAPAAAVAATPVAATQRSAEPGVPVLRRKVVRRMVVKAGAAAAASSRPLPALPAHQQPKPASDAALPVEQAERQADSSDSQGERKRRKRKRRRGKGRNNAEGAADAPASTDAAEARGTAPAGIESHDVPRSVRRRSVAAPEPGELERWDEIFEKQTFADLGLRSSVLKGIQACGFKYPTKIQSQLIPLMIAGHDVLGQSRTGTGKTAAFGLPLFHNAQPGKAYQTIILAPTRELAIQIADELRDIGRFTPIKVGVVYGGQKMNQQQRALEAGPEIIVATPGRLMDVHRRGWLHFHDVTTVVLDEVDRMLDIGFREDIRDILSRMKGEHQTVLVSATISEEIEKLARKFMRADVQRLETVGTSLTVALIQQHYVSVQPWDKMRMLHHLLTHEEPSMTLVFCNMKRTVDKVTQFLRKKGLDADAIHGDLPQGMRNAIMRKLHDGKLHMLICSDLAARGLDVQGVSHVVNYDLPEDPEVYIHRVGRTARAGRDGIAWALVTPNDGHLLTQIEILANIHIPEKKLPDFVPGPEPEHIVADRAAQERRLEQVRAAKNRFASSTTNVEQLSKAAISAGRANPFPTGPIPTKLPPRKLGGKIKTARSMKDAPPPGLSGGA